MLGLLHRNQKWMPKTVTRWYLKHGTKYWTMDSYHMQEWSEDIPCKWFPKPLNKWSIVFQSIDFDEIAKGQT
jgi:hypothetical protein